MASKSVLKSFSLSGSNPIPNNPRTRLSSSVSSLPCITIGFRTGGRVLVGVGGKGFKGAGGRGGVC